MSSKLSAETIKKAISYFYLLSYSPPHQINVLKESLGTLRKDLADSAGMSEKKFFKAAIPEVCRRIVAFHEDTREPNPQWVKALGDLAYKADKSPEDAYAFQSGMAEVAYLPQRALPENRHHRKKGCDICQRPCQYGYFTLVSEPEFDTLQELLEEEIDSSSDTQSVIRPVWSFALSHLFLTIGYDAIYAVHQEHLGNLSYCLLMLAMAKSRLAIPEKQLKVYQALNQELIQANE